MDRYTIMSHAGRWGGFCYYWGPGQDGCQRQLYRDHRYEREVVELIENGHYDLLIDVGAAFGYFTQVGLSRCTGVIAFESNPDVVGYMLANVGAAMNLRIVITRVGRDAGCSLDGYMAEFSIPRETRMLVKLDVEGDENAVLDGAVGLIGCPNVDWMIEVHTAYGVLVEDIDAKMVGYHGRPFPISTFPEEEGIEFQVYRDCLRNVCYRFYARP